MVALARGTQDLSRGVALEQPRGHGNVVGDRVRDGAVTDFIDLPLWPTFNLADVAITVGVLLLLLDVERSGGRGRGS